MKDEKDFTTVIKNSVIVREADYIESLLKSMLCAIEKVKTGSLSENGYFHEKYGKLQKLFNEVSQ